MEDDADQQLQAVWMRIGNAGEQFESSAAIESVARRRDRELVRKQQVEKRSEGCISQMYLEKMNSVLRRESGSEEATMGDESRRR